MIFVDTSVVRPEIGRMMIGLEVLVKRLSEALVAVSLNVNQLTLTELDR